MGQHRICTVSFTDPEGISHAVDVTAATLYEAAVLAVAEFRRAGLFEVHIGPGTRLRVAVKQPEAVHEIQFGKLQEWLGGGARSPHEQVMKARLRRTCWAVEFSAHERTNLFDPVVQLVHANQLRQSAAVVTQSPQ